jgi:hypothetical protein
MIPDTMIRVNGHQGIMALRDLHHGIHVPCNSVRVPHLHPLPIILPQILLHQLEADLLIAGVEVDKRNEPVGVLLGGLGHEGVVLRITEDPEDHRYVHTSGVHVVYEEGGRPRWGPALRKVAMSINNNHNFFAPYTDTTH